MNNFSIKDFDNVVSFDIVKEHMNTFFFPMTKSIHEQIGLRSLFQLRVSLSPLRSHKMYHKFIDTLRFVIARH